MFTMDNISLHMCCLGSSTWSWQSRGCLWCAKVMSKFYRSYAFQDWYAWTDGLIWWKSVYSSLFYHICGRLHARLRAEQGIPGCDPREDAIRTLCGCTRSEHGRETKRRTKVKQQFFCTRWIWRSFLWGKCMMLNEPDWRHYLTSYIISYTYMYIYIVDIVKIIVSIYSLCQIRCFEEGMTLWSLALWVAESLRIPPRQWTWMRKQRRKKNIVTKSWRQPNAVRNSVLRISVNCWEGHCGGMAKALRTRWGEPSDAWFGWKKKPRCLLLKRGGEFGNAFKHVVFAIAFSKKNFQGFAVPWIQISNVSKFILDFRMFVRKLDKKYQPWVCLQGSIQWPWTLLRWWIWECRSWRRFVETFEVLKFFCIFCILLFVVSPESKCSNCKRKISFSQLMPFDS